MDEQILNILTKQKLMDEKVLALVKDLMARGKTLEQAVVGGRYVNDVNFAKAKAEAMALPFVDLTERIIPKETLELVPQDARETFSAVPVEFDGKTLQIALLNPNDIKADEALQFLASDKGWTIKYVIAPTSQINSLLKKIKGLGTEVATALAQAKGRFEHKEEKTEELGKLEEVIRGAPVSRMISVIMRHAVEGGASDIHIEPIGDESRVRYRIDGVLRTTLVLPIYVHPALVSRVKVLANLKIDETRMPQDGRITQDVGGRKIDFRISTLPVVDNEKVVMRVLDTSASAPTLENLGYRKEHVDLIKEHIKRPFGMLLVTGPTGSGKSTTLFAVLTSLNSEGINISTLEDPVEYYVPGVNQSQIKPEIGYTFASGLRSLLRQDPNVIMVGEVRDRETAELAIHASLTGHLVFSTLHTNDVYGIVPRLIDMGVEPFLLAATLNLGIAQRLARRICTYCKAAEEIEPEVIEKLRREIKLIPTKYFAPNFTPDGPLEFKKGRGCPRCGDTGYQGRIACAEVVEFTDQMRKLSEKGFPLKEVRDEVIRQQALTLRQDALLKALDGHTTVSEVYRLSQEVQEDV
ncbi:type II/IV secretion system protein [Candidatus Uhrbacteria bacterium]|nr:type II/IV secretion system protein [Candidatus Uhrbacteria bacterium]